MPLVRRSVLSRAFAALVVLALPASAWAESVYRETLGSGLTVVIQEHHSTAAVEVRVAVRAAPLYEGPLLGSGASLLLQRMLVTSAQSDLPADEVRRAIAALGNHFAASADVAASSYAISTTGDRTGEALALIAGMIANYAYTTADLQRERQSLLAQQPLAPSAADLLAGVLYRTHPARLPTAGLPRMMEQLTVELMRKYQAARYTAANTVVVVVGNVNTGEVRRQVEQAFARYPIGGFQQSTVPDEAPQFTPRFATGRTAAATPRVLLAWRTESLEHPDQPALAVLAEALGDDRRGLLRRALPAAPQTDLDVDAPLPVDQPGWLAISFNAAGGDRAAIEQAVRGCLAAVAQQGLPPDDLEAAKHAVALRLASRLASVHGIVDDLVRWELATGDPAYGGVFGERVLALAVEDIQRVARRYLAPDHVDRTCTVVMRPPQEDAADSGTPAAPTGVLAPAVLDLDHGMRALIRPVDELPLVHIRVVLGGGAGADPDGQAGASALLVAAMARATAQRPAAVLERLLDAHGMTVTTGADAHAATIALTCLPEDVDLGLELAVECLVQPGLGQDDVDAARARLGRQIDRAAQQWDRRLLGDLRRIVFAGHYAGRDPLGRKDQLAGIDRAAVAAHYRRLAVGANALICVYGRCDGGRVAERLQALVASRPLPIGAAPTRPAAQDVPAAAPLTVATHDGAGTAVAIGWTGGGLADRTRDEAPLAVLSALLAGVGQPGGRINQALLAVDTRPRLVAARDLYADRGLWVLYGQIDPRAAEAAQRVAREQIAGLVRQLALPAGDAAGLSDAELAAAKAACVTALTLAQEDQAASAARHAGALLAVGDLAGELDLVERVRLVEPADVARVAAAWLTRDPVVVLHRPKGEDTSMADAPREPIPVPR